MNANDRSFRIARARPEDVDDLHALIRALADYERLGDICTSTPRDLADALFGPHPVAEALISRLDGKSHVCIGFALFFHTYSTFNGRRSLWLEDLFVRPEHRGAGVGRAPRGAGMKRRRGPSRRNAGCPWRAARDAAPSSVATPTAGGRSPHRR